MTDTVTLAIDWTEVEAEEDGGGGLFVDIEGSAYTGVWTRDKH